MIDLEKFQAIFKEYPYIACAYLFGSFASGKTGPMSDMDIAILLKSPYPQGRELIHEEDYLAYRISKSFGIREIDLIDLNSQKLIFQHNVLKTSKLIYDSDPEFRIRFESHVIMEYCDFESTLRFIKKFKRYGLEKRLTKI
ncbi:MAG: type VII toxin-antitoxin system MntA family adenylyltransferase antitoxin [Candidatus Jordarchaeum sp.]|uniref:type VII toxin-antitoxin system MntA family adenylyltransferase antitoxin n=1 Tax=Candidatus Jordarchaeum sp. TaxID=2823881 RepID=UPI00404B6905